jgi:hypothetical protein
MAEKADQPLKLTVLAMNMDSLVGFNAANMTPFTAMEADSSAESYTSGPQPLRWQMHRQPG